MGGLKKRKPPKSYDLSGFDEIEQSTCRDDRIRTCGLVVPNDARYRAALHPEWVAQSNAIRANLARAGLHSVNLNFAAAPAESVPPLRAVLPAWFRGGPARRQPATTVPGACLRARFP